MEEILKNLNPKQKEAVLVTEGPVLILAGPGSGKTATLTARIVYLIIRGIPPANILAVTFTNKAAEEMKERVIRFLSKTKKVPIYTLTQAKSTLNISTFHSFCVRVLRQYHEKQNLPPNFTIFDKDDSLSVLKQAMEELKIDFKQFPPLLIYNQISRLKNELIDPETFAQQNDLSEGYTNKIHKIYTQYTQNMHKLNALDFDDLLMKTVQLFRQNPDILSSYQNTFRYIHIDEYQDTNYAQYVLVRQLAEKHKNIAVVGDDAQAIYAFRGADYRNILNFEKDWPEAHTVVLDQNYRSTQIILDAASGIISQNQAQKKKRLWTERKEGEPVYIIVAENEQKEGEMILEKIRELNKQGYSLGDIAILYRTNAQSRSIEDILIQNNIPYTIVGGVGFYQRKEIKDIIAYIRTILNPKDSISLSRIINIPSRGIGKKSLFAYLNSSIEMLRQAEAKRLIDFDQLIDSLRKEACSKKVKDFLNILLSKINYQSYLETTTQNADQRWENVEELIGLGAKYDHIQPPHGLEHFLEQITLMTDVDKYSPSKEKLTLMTLHAAKGLEFRVVFIIGMEEGILPHSRSLLNPSDLEEERRLCYVGMTRAKDLLYLSFALYRNYLGSSQANPPSRFLKEIPQNLILPVYNEQEIDYS